MEEKLETFFKKRMVSLEQGYEQKIAELSLLKEMGESLKGMSLSHWEEIFFRQLDIIKQHTGIYSISIMLLDRKTRSLYVVSASHIGYSPQRAPIRLNPGEGIAGRVFETAKTLYIPDVTKESGFSDRGTDQKGALACVPIVSEGNCIGVVNFRDNFPGSFEPNDLRIFELVADQLSITASLVRTYLDLLALEKKRMNLSRYFSRGLAEHLLADERMNRLGGQQKTVTVIFVDIAGFSSLVESYPVEDVVGMLNQFFATVVPVIFNHDGMLDKFLGDGVMAVFGIPDADVKDSLKAIECASEIQKKVKGLSKSLEKQELAAIDVGIGIATGDVLAGNIGTEEQMNYTVIGEPVNLAQRLESISSPGEIIVSQLTLERAQAYAKPQIQFEPIGIVKVKGIQRKISAMRVISQI